MLSAILGPATQRAPATTLATLPATWMTAACMDPRFRRITGWLGLAWCSGPSRGWTCRIAARPGIFGLYPTEVDADATPASASFRVLYLPGAHDPILDHLNLAAAILAAAPDAATDFRAFPEHPDLAAACAIADIHLVLDQPAEAIAIALTADAHRRIVAPEGIADDAGRWLVPPGADEETLPAFALARDLFRVLAAGVAAATGQAPEPPRRSLAPAVLHRRDGDGTLREAGHAGTRITEALAWGPMPAAWEPPPLPGDAEPYRICAEACGAADPSPSAVDPDRPDLIVLSGFLGAGKTSFLNQFIEFHAAHDRLVAVIQNEIGETGVDTHMLEGDRSVLTLDAGCVCCSLAGHLGAGLRRLSADLAPEVVVLETTGLANPLNLVAELDAIADLARLRAVVTVVDAARFWPTLADSDLAGAQIAAADTVIVNKCDLVDRAAREAVEAEIHRRNPTARVIPAEHGRVPPAAVADLGGGSAARLCGSDHGGHTHADEGYTALRLALADTVDRDALLACLAATPPGVMRIKGIVRLADVPTPRVVQYVPGSAALEPAAKPVSVAPFVLVIGRDLDPARLRHLWRELLKEPHHVVD